MRPRYRVRSSPRTSQFGKSDNPRNVGGRTKSAARKSRIDSEFRHIYRAQRSSKHHQIYGEGAIGRFLVPEPLPKRLLSSSCASANARAIRWSLDRQQRADPPTLRTGPLIPSSSNAPTVPSSEATCSANVDGGSSTDAARGGTAQKGWLVQRNQAEDVCGPRGQGNTMLPADNDHPWRRADVWDLPVRGKSQLTTLSYGSRRLGWSSFCSTAFLAKSAACSGVCRLSFDSDIHWRMIFRRTS